MEEPTELMVTYDTGSITLIARFIVVYHAGISIRIHNLGQQFVNICCLINLSQGFHYVFHTLA